MRSPKTVFAVSAPNRHLFLLLRQPHAERRFAGLTFELNPALMFVKNLPANIEAEAAPFARRFRREKRLENAVCDLRRNAAAGIGDFNDNSGVL